MKIRPEALEDHQKITELVAVAYQGAEESTLVDALRPDAHLSLVAEDEGEIVGHALLSPLEAPFAAGALAPLSVAPLWQGQGIGGALVREVCRLAPCDAIFLRGDPAFYGRFGFRADLAAGYACVFAGPFFLVKPLRDIPATGRVLYPRAFSAAGSSGPR
ncbi:GNAT family N-acetyltransferase [Falsirhodobacter sp. 20TX0035]|uniref:GNAT family N-acetyltransferase n=1 Tax=Falsirhodobacter sp. 20TX0035 TaxID=3022019 RepID=UPI00232C84CA|nr:N-acetyltransferase [Falsirhodobacter sp. 20TX0035]MDB6453144.1 N-acetyltransferase [Falsirhodobacter sp. 20TX0035]